MMEAGENKESKASGDDTESSEQVDEDARGRRFYECIFCKRGFSTAQALGGHMNIHRKDRVKIRSTVIPSICEETGEGSERCGSHYLIPIPSHHSSNPPFSELLTNYATHFPGSGSSNREVKVSGDEDDHSRTLQELSLFGENELHLDSRFHGGDEAVEDREERNMDGKEEELDLELRLGHEPETRS